jgi:hypothetical protein
MSIADTIQRIEAAGFHLVADGDDIVVTPAGLMTDLQKDWIRQRKTGILAALRASESLLDAGGGDDLPPANDPRITVHVPEFTLSTGQRVSFDLDVPTANVPTLRQSLRFELKDGQGGGSILGQPGGTEEHLRDVLVRKYRGRLATINGMEVFDD